MSSVHTAPLAGSPETLQWRMPISPLDYADHNPLLSEEERRGIEQLLSLSYGQWRAVAHQLAELERITKPLLDVIKLFHQRRPKSLVARKHFLDHLLGHVLHTNTVYWGWSSSRWETVIQTIPTRPKDVAQRRTPGHTSSTSPNLLLTYLAAYLLTHRLPLTNEKPLRVLAFAQIVFGPSLVQAALDRVKGPWLATGYSERGRNLEDLIHVMLLALLVNQHPDLSALTASALGQASALNQRKDIAHRFAQLHHVLIDLAILSEEEVKQTESRPATMLFQEEYVQGIHPRWVSWVRAFWQHTPWTERHRTAITGQALMAGRWLAQHHPLVTEPKEWSREIALAYVAYTCNEATVFDYASPLIQRQRLGKSGEPLKPASISARLGGLRAFFRGLQKYAYEIDGQVQPPLVITWNPAFVLATPQQVMTQIQPHPRNVEEEAWLKLVWTACTLSAEMVKEAAPRTTYPLLLLRAVALVWVTGCRRSDEIRRLPLDCVRSEWAPEMVDEQGVQLEPAEHLWYLLVPSNKYRGTFWTPIPQYSAEAILAWKAVRPKNQPPLRDRKTRKLTEYLFQYRRKKIGDGYITDHLIPLLCKAAGLTDEAGQPYKDAMGPITSHRARSSTAYYLKAMGMTPYDIGKLLGHTNPNKTLPWYLKENLHQLGRMYRKANPLDRTVHALLDTQAAGRGEPCVFYYLSDSPDGRPRLCGNPHFRTCYHQLQCAECAAYVDVDMAEMIEQRPGVLHVSVPLPLPEQLVDDLNKREEGLPTASPPPPPPLPSPAFHFNKNVVACVASDQSLSEGEQLRLRLQDLEAQLATTRKRDTRNVALRLLKQEISDLKRRLAELEKGEVHE
jgi:integrase